MLDPFPVPQVGLLSQAVKPFADFFSLTTLPLHIHEVLLAFLFYHYTNTVFSPYLSARFFPKTYNAFNKRTKINWDVHVVSLVQSTLINALALWVMWTDEERAEMNWKGRVWGYTGSGGLVQAMAAGYFIWDLWITAVHVNIFGPGALAHAISAITVFSLGFRPFVNYYAPIFILYELSTPFLNVHWFCDKLDLTGSNLQLVNGILLISTFAGCRLIWGTYNSILVFSDVWKAYSAGSITPELVSGGATSAAGSAAAAFLDEPVSEVMRFAGERAVPLWLAFSYLASNLVLNGLNWYWMAKMIETLRKRFDPPLGTRTTEEKNKHEEKYRVKQVEVQRGVYADGHKSVEVNEKTVRNRRPG